MSTPPRRVGVVGAGMVGLATAWFLQERGVAVTVFDRDRVAAGASWGNAGWLTPGLVTPLPDPALLRFGLRAALNPASPVYVPLRPDPTLLRFLAGFVRCSTARRWREAMGALVPFSARAYEAFDHLAAAGVREPVREAGTFLACYRRGEEARGLLAELEHIRACGRVVEHEVIDGAAARSLEPALSPSVGAAVRLLGQRYLHPGRYVDALAEAVRQRGGTLRVPAPVEDVRDDGRGVVVRWPTGSERYDSVVLATGAWLGRLAHRFGVRTIVQAGRGYSFSVPVDPVPRGPVYFPAQRVACTPLGDRVRVAGMMEFRPAGAALDPRRIEAVAAAARPLLAGADFAARTDEWVGPRPCTPDGLPLIGCTRSPRVFVAGGHGMWGITLGPLTGQLLADALMTGRTPSVLRPFDPLR